MAEFYEPRKPTFVSGRFWLGTESRASARKLTFVSRGPWRPRSAWWRIAGDPVSAICSRPWPAASWRVNVLDSSPPSWSNPWSSGFSRNWVCRPVLPQAPARGTQLQARLGCPKPCRFKRPSARGRGTGCAWGTPGRAGAERPIRPCKTANEASTVPLQQDWSAHGGQRRAQEPFVEPRRTRPTSTSSKNTGL